MTQFEIEDLFKSLGYECDEDHVGEEVKDYGYYVFYRSEEQSISFMNRDGKLKIVVDHYYMEEMPTITSGLALAIAEQVKFILQEYKGEIE
jgi:hypothetical protein